MMNLLQECTAVAEDDVRWGNKSSGGRAAAAIRPGHQTKMQGASADDDDSN